MIKVITIDRECSGATDIAADQRVRQSRERQMPGGHVGGAAPDADRILFQAQLELTHLRL